METVIDNNPQQVLGAAPAQQSLLRPYQAQAVATLMTPDVMLGIAVQRGDSIEVLTKLMDLKDRYDKSEAIKAYNVAFAAFKAEAVVLIRNKLIADGPLKGKKHAELSDAVNAATPALSKHGLSATWKLSKDEKDWMEVTCTVRHAAGHSESVAMGGAPDTGPGRNAMQARGSSKTYLERYTMTAILGLAAQDADDDGAGGATEKAAADNQLLTRLKGEAEATTTDADAAAYWRANAKLLGHWQFGYDKFKAAVAAHRTALKQAVAA